MQAFKAWPFAHQSGPGALRAVSINADNDTARKSNFSAAWCGLCGDQAADQAIGDIGIINRPQHVLQFTQCRQIGLGAFARKQAFKKRAALAQFFQFNPDPMPVIAQKISQILG